MPQNFSKIKYVTGDEAVLEKIFDVSCKKVFDNRVTDFLNDLSICLLKDKRVKQYADVAEFAFWIRKSVISKEASKYANEHRIGRGVVFHIAPSNIPVQFAVTLVYALVSGNASIVRISDKEFEQTDIICENMENLLKNKYTDLRNYILIVRYEHDDEINKFFTSQCDARVIWGGDRTIKNFANMPVKERTVEIKFADRYSIAVIDADEYLKLDKEAVANNFYKDTYLIDQNACSSPRLVVWKGKKISEAKERFWSTLKELVDSKYNFNPINGCEKLLDFAKLAMQDGSVRIIKHDNNLVRIEIKNIDETIMEYKGNCGYFFETEITELSQLVPILKKKCQTVTCCGVNPKDVYDVIIENGVKGCDRIVEMGNALELSFIWDGYDIIKELSRIVSFQAR